MAENETPILVREVIQADGSHVFGLRVFCSSQGRSVALDVCRACPACLEMGGDLSGTSAWLRCAPTVNHDEAPEALAGPHATGSDSAAAAGAILKATVTAVRSDLPLCALRSLFVERGLSRVFVLDDADRLVGVVGELDLLVSRFPRRANDRSATSSAFSCVDPRVPGTADGIMSGVHAIPEETPIREALLEMAASRVRQAPIVTREGVLVGTLVDIDGLGWIAAHRRI